MRPSDYLKAAGVAIVVITLTLALSFPMVFAYATFIEPGHPQDFYNEAALWIAPWSSHIFGPILFFVFGFILARRRPERNTVLFGLACLVFYVLIDFSLVPLTGGSLTGFLDLVVAMSLGGKLAGALLGGWLGQRQGQAKAVAA